MEGAAAVAPTAELLKRRDTIRHHRTQYDVESCCGLNIVRGDPETVAMQQRGLTQHTSKGGPGSNVI
jgi:hypothetical protein